MSGVDLSGLSVRDLLRLSAQLLTELADRGVIRSRNAPAGDLGEFLVSVAYGGKLAPRSAKSWDVLAADGGRLQVKTRLVDPQRPGTAYFSPFRSFDFDRCVFVRLDVFSYEVLSAVEVPAEVVRQASREVAWVNGWRVGARTPLVELPGARDVTEILRSALAELDVAPVG